MESLIKRKDFFKEAFWFFKKEFETTTNANIEENLPFILPPGAKDKESFLDTCEQCYECVSICPHESIRVWRNEDYSKFYGYL